MGRHKEHTPTINKQGYWTLHGMHCHRVAGAESIGRPTEKGEVVHHIDGNRLNNEWSNLHVCSTREHFDIHNDGHPLSARIQEGPFMGPFRPLPGY